MTPPPSGAFRVCRIAGIDVYVHWLWIVLACYEILYRSRDGFLAYESKVWYSIEYFALFGIVLLHEFGHALACRSVGGTADRVVLWLLGGVAYVNPPPRPGAMLWSIAAGPLVNVALVPVLFGLYVLSASSNPGSDLTLFLQMLSILNGVLLAFNALPVYPLDGGQILQALLWFVIGRVQSLQVVSILGLVCGIGAVIAAATAGNYWMAMMAIFIAFRSWAGFNQANVLSRILHGPRHLDAACPSCGEAPFKGNYWVCDYCRKPFDVFEHQHACPSCGESFPMTTCPNCRRRHPVAEWLEARLVKGQKAGA